MKKPVNRSPVHLFALCTVVVGCALLTGCCPSCPVCDCRTESAIIVQVYSNGSAGESFCYFDVYEAGADPNLVPALGSGSFLMTANPPEDRARDGYGEIVMFPRGGLYDIHCFVDLDMNGHLSTDDMHRSLLSAATGWHQISYNQFTLFN